MKIGIQAVAISNGTIMLQDRRKASNNLSFKQLLLPLKKLVKSKMVSYIAIFPVLKQ